MELLDRVQSRAMKLIGDVDIVSSIDSPEHLRHVRCVTLF